MTILTKVDSFPDFSLRVTMPTRSLLFSLEPAGVGTRYQESLLSLLVRTSRAHAVNPRLLIRDVCSEVDVAIAKLPSALFYQRLAGTINGLGQYAQLFVSVMEKLTGRTGLRNCTVLPWRHLFPHNGQGLLARHPRWCPVCLDERYQQSEVAALPLIWSLETYRICRIHRVPLEHLCSSCGKVQSFIPCHPYIGCCGYCQRPLGCPRPPQAVPHFQSWVAEVIEEMVERQSMPGFSPSLERFQEFVRNQVAAYSQGNRAAFCRALGFNEFGLNGWLNKGERPSITQFLALCYGTKTMPTDIFCICRPLSVASVLRRPTEKLKQRLTRPRFTHEQYVAVRQSLQEFLSSRDGLSVSVIRKKLGLGRTCLRYWFPDLCILLSKQHLTMAKKCSEARRTSQCLLVRKIVNGVKAEGGRLSKRRIDALLRAEGLSLSQPHLIAAYKAVLATP